MTSYPNVGQSWQQQQNQQEAQSSLPTNSMASPVFSKYNAVIDENLIVMDYKPPGNIPPPFCENQCSNNNPPTGSNAITNKKVQWVYNPLDGSVLMDHNGVPLSVDRLLATNPLKHELSTRPGPGNKKLTYISGDDVSRTLNDVFGFDGWDLDIKDVSRVETSKDPKTGKHTIVYTARVRLTHKASGTYKEDCGAGDSTDRVYGTAIAHALKASITDAMKRAARHFGDKLGNSLYSGNFNINKAPVSLKDALDKYDIHRCNTKFGFNKQNASPIPSMTANTTASSISASYNPPCVPPTTAPAQPSNPKTQQTDSRNQRVVPVYTNPPTNSSVQQQHRQTYPQHQHGTTSAPKVGSKVLSVPPSDIVRPTTSYGRRPALGSNNATKQSKNMISQLPITHGGDGGSNNNIQSNSNNKRPPLGAIAHYPTTSGISSDLSSKRQKQQRHHNPYNHSVTGRKSI